MDYSPNIEKRLVKALQCLFGSEATGQEVFVTLTAKMTDPRKTKQSFRKWIGAMCYKFDCFGIYVVEFGLAGMVHYHVALRFKEPTLTDEMRSELANECFARWACYGDRNRQAFEFQHVYNIPRLIRYMAKLPDEKGQPHFERWQKCLPPALQEHGLGANWWGYVNRKGVKANPATMTNRVSRRFAMPCIEDKTQRVVAVPNPFE